MTEEKISLASKLYIDTGLSVAEIATALNESPAHIAAAATAQNWDELRSVNHLSPSALIRLYYQQSKAIMQQAEDSKEGLTLQQSNTLNNLAAAIQKIDKRVDPGVVMEVLRNFTDYLIKLQPKLAKDIAPHQLAYVRKLLNS